MKINSFQQQRPLFGTTIRVLQDPTGKIAETIAKTPTIIKQTTETDLFITAVAPKGTLKPSLVQVGICGSEVGKLGKSQTLPQESLSPETLVDICNDLTGSKH